MPRVKQITAKEAVIEGFEGTRNSNSFKQFSDEWYLGYIVAITNINNPGQGHSVAEYAKAAQECLNEGLLA